MGDTLKFLSVEYDSGSNQFVQHIRRSSVNDLEKIINCECVNCATFDIDDDFFDVWYDDDFLNKPEPIPTFYLSSYQILCGNLVFAKTDDEGETIGLTARERSKIWKFYLSHFHLLIKYLAEYHTENFLLNLTVNDHCLPALKGIYKDFGNYFSCPPVDDQFRKFGVI